MWKNGFTVSHQDEEGPLRSYEDPNNKEFLKSIEKGEPPRELLRQAEGAEVHLDMQDHREEEYQPPKNKYVLYNDGYKLGSPTPTVVSNASQNDVESNEKQAKQELSCDESKSTTNIQVRLSNGSRLIIKANQTHRVSDLRRYINRFLFFYKLFESDNDFLSKKFIVSFFSHFFKRARPEYNGRVYSLLTSFPNKEIENENQTLQDANILNAVIIQKLTQ